MTTTTFASPAGLLTEAADRKAFRQSFRIRAQRKALSASDMALYALALGKPLETVFTPVTNGVKLANGAAPWFGATLALNALAFNSKALSLLEEAGLAGRSEGFAAAAIAARKLLGTASR